MTEEELTSLRRTHDFQMAPTELVWLNEEAKRLFGSLENQATEILRSAYETAQSSERAYRELIPRARRSVEPIRLQQREILRTFTRVSMPMIMAKPKPTETTCET